jgi:hypothetical protein
VLIESDQFCSNMLRIKGLTLPNLTVEQTVAADSALDSRFHYSQGVWWREVKPFFYQPAAMLQPVALGSAVPRPWLALGGYYHVVPTWGTANGKIVANQLSSIAEYALDRLKKQVRYEIRRGLGAFRIDRLTRMEDLSDDGYNIYLKWEKKVGKVRVKRSNPKIFKRWINGVLRHPGNLTLGAYDHDRLVSYIIVRSVEGVAELAKSFTDPDYYRLSPSSALFYSYIEICRRNPRIHTICSGLQSMSSTLEAYKKKLGFEHVSYPAYIRLCPILRPLVRRLMPGQYSRLMGQYEN